jgi:hypothetical protein
LPKNAAALPPIILRLQRTLLIELGELDPPSVHRWNATSGRVAQKCGGSAANYLRLQRTLLIQLEELDPPSVHRWNATSGRVA